MPFDRSQNHPEGREAGNLRLSHPGRHWAVYCAAARRLSSAPLRHICVIAKVITKAGCPQNVEVVQIYDDFPSLDDPRLEHALAGKGAPAAEVRHGPRPRPHIHYRHVHYRKCLAGVRQLRIAPNQGRKRIVCWRQRAIVTGTTFNFLGWAFRGLHRPIRSTQQL